jgi:hypothetical protein
MPDDLEKIALAKLPLNNLCLCTSCFNTGEQHLETSYRAFGPLTKPSVCCQQPLAGFMVANKIFENNHLGYVMLFNSLNIQG